MGKSVYDTYESSGKGPIVQVLEQPKIESDIQAFWQMRLRHGVRDAASVIA
jgi:hypothetical protein